MIKLDSISYQSANSENLLLSRALYVFGAQTAGPRQYHILNIVKGVLLLECALQLISLRFKRRSFALLGLLLRGRVLEFYLPVN